jgi:hypothetical protein
MTATVTFPIISGNANGFNMMPFGGGGFVTGGDFSADGNRAVHATDVGGAYIKDIGVDTQWRPLFTSSSLPTADFDPKPSAAGSDGDGCYDIKIAQSDKDCLVAGYNGYVFRSTNGGANWTRCNLANKRMFANTSSAPFRVWQQKIAIHPTDKLTFLVGTWGDGQHYTTDGGSNFTSVGIAAGTQVNSLDPAHLVAVDPGNANYWYISRHGTGIYRSTTGVAGPYTLITPGPTSAVAMQVTPTGVLWVLTYQNTLYKIARGSGTTWTQISLTALSGFTSGSFAVDPANENSLIVMDGNGPIGISTDGGSSWVGGGFIRDTSPTNGILHVAASVPWLGGFSQGFFPARLQFRPGQTNDLYIFHGTGIAHGNPPSTFVATSWTDDTLGNEELGVLCGLSIPGNTKPLFGFADKGLVRINNFDLPRAIPFFPDGSLINVGINHCPSIDYSPDDANYLVAICNTNNAISGYSTDGGATWQVFAAQHPDGAISGQIICTGGTGATAKIIWVPSNNGKAVRSSNGGASWSYINMGGSSGGISNWINSIWTRRYPAASDKQTAGVASIVVNNSNQGITAGVYRTTDHGANWTQTFSGVIDSSSGADSAQFWECKLKYIDGKAGQLLYCGGQGFPDFNSKLKYLANDTTNSWTTLGSGVIDNVHQVDCGVGYSGTTFPAVYFNGKVNGVSGIYRSKDFFATTPELLGRFPASNPFYIQTLVGDRNKQGRVFVGFNSGGAAYGNFV